MFLFGMGFSTTNQKRCSIGKNDYEFIVDEILIKVGDEFSWLWIATEPKDKTILEIHISYERSMLIAEHFMRSLLRKYGEHSVFTDGMVYGIHHKHANSSN